MSSDIQCAISELERLWGPYPKDKPTQEADLEDEWQAKLVSMSPKEFAQLMVWIQQGEAYER